MSDKPIGMLDSGMGGLSVFREVRALLPRESVVYLADGLNCPYGSRSMDDIRRLTLLSVERLLDEGAKIVVVACNTATAASISYLRERYDVPFVGMEPAVKPAALRTRSGIVGILATEGSLHGELFAHTSGMYRDRIRIIPAVGEGFVEIVERGEEHTPMAFETVRRVIAPMLEQGVDELVLGCTHYPFLIDAIRSAVGDRDVEIVDPSPAVARRVRDVIRSEGLECGADHVPEYRFLSFADEEYVDRVRRRAAMK